MQVLKRIILNLPAILASPLLSVIALMALLLADLWHHLFGRIDPGETNSVNTFAASVVIPNWNGRDLLEQYLPSVVEAMRINAANEIIVVDNGSTDGSAEFIRDQFPEVRLLALERNLGFGGGSNLGFREARNDVVVLLNSDMRVAPDFLQPLLDAFSDRTVFAVSAQIFFSDPDRKREETGLTHGWWTQGFPRLRHVADDEITIPFPCFYPGGGSSAFDRRKFLALGGFDELLAPFYLEDTDIGFQAWKRGWKVLYQPASRVWHEHRGTIGRNFNLRYIDNTIRKNQILFCWKNIHEPSRLCQHFIYAWAGALLSVLGGDSLERSNLTGLWRAFRQLPQAIRSRLAARSRASITDTEAFRRPLGGYFRDRFAAVETSPDRLNVLFLSPYPVWPPTHGGAVFMNQTLRRLGTLADVHLICLVDEPWEIEAHQNLSPSLKSMKFLIRLEGQPKGIGALDPYAVREFRNLELEWLVHRQMYVHQIHVLQIEYTNMGQYAPALNRIPTILFEHDVYFQSIARQLPSLPALSRLKGTLEYLRALRYELTMLPALDRIQTCTLENRRLLESFLPQLSTRIDDHVRAGIDVALYPFHNGARRPGTMLFLGSFRHTPNATGIRWFLYEVMPRILEAEPSAILTVIGSDPPPPHTLPDYGGAVKLLGFVDDLDAAMAQHAVFICPILAGSGLRVKLLEAFSSGIPVVSTRVGAEGLGAVDGELCRLGDTAQEFADRVVAVLRNPEDAAQMAQRARQYVLNHRDIATMTQALERTYRAALISKANGASPDPT